MLLLIYVYSTWILDINELGAQPGELQIPLNVPLIHNDNILIVDKVTCNNKVVISYMKLILIDDHNYTHVVYICSVIAWFK